MASNPQVLTSTVEVAFDHVVSFYVGVFERLPKGTCCLLVAPMTWERRPLCMVA
jgi:hypothetical protein